MTSLEALQEWYVSQCNEDWEHTGTSLEGKAYPAYSYGIDERSEPAGQDWITSKVEKNKRMKSACRACPTRNGEAPLLAAQLRR